MHRSSYRTEARASRRGLLKGVGQVGLSAVAITLLAGCESMAASDKKMMAAANPADDVSIAQYRAGTGISGDRGLSGRCRERACSRSRVLAVAVQFQGDHKKHAEVLSSTITKLGGMPIAGQDAAASYGFPTAQLKTPGRCPALRRRAREGRRLRLSRRGAGVQQPRSRQGCRQHSRRRDHALGGAAERARRESGAGPVHRLAPPRQGPPSPDVPCRSFSSRNPS